MHGVFGVGCHSGVVVIVLTIFWATVDRFFSWCIGRFLLGTVNRCFSVSFDRAEYYVSYSASEWQGAMIPGSLILLEDVCGFLTGIGL